MTAECRCAIYNANLYILRAARSEKLRAAKHCRNIVESVEKNDRLLQFSHRFNIFQWAVKEAA